ncbi:MAG: Ppx/GppA family phosphatase [Firmicutes bacterium]|nr:Ppx/GppA family phosphatase [Bacillota bacterium]
MIVAAVDIGSNSVRLLVAEVNEQGQVAPLHSDLKTTRLGRGIMAGRLLPAAMEKTLAVLEQYLKQAEELGAQNILLAATSAVRDAANRDEFIRLVAGVTERPLQVLSGKEEARLSFLGAMGGLSGVRNPLVVDIGGGSTEFSWSVAGRLASVSVSVGAVRMTEGGYGNGQIRRVIEPALSVVRRYDYGEVVGVGGTVTTMAAMAIGLELYDPKLVHGFRLTREDVLRLDGKLHGITLAERKRLPGLQPERADIIPAGARILSRVMQGLGANSVLVSEADILYGLVGEARKMS